MPAPLPPAPSLTQSTVPAVSGVIPVTSSLARSSQLLTLEMSLSDLSAKCSKACGPEFIASPQQMQDIFIVIVTLLKCKSDQAISDWKPITVSPATRLSPAVLARHQELEPVHLWLPRRHCSWSPFPSRSEIDIILPNLLLAPMLFTYCVACTPQVSD